MMANPPKIEGFRPFGVPMTNIEPVVLLFEEYESMRLADYEGLTEECRPQKNGHITPYVYPVYMTRPARPLPRLLWKGKLSLSKGAIFIRMITGIVARIVTDLPSPRKRLKNVVIAVQNKYIAYRIPVLKWIAREGRVFA